MTEFVDTVEVVRHVVCVSDDLSHVRAYTWASGLTAEYNQCHHLNTKYSQLKKKQFDKQTIQIKYGIKSISLMSRSKEDLDV